MDCLFCKIAAKEIPSEVVYEDEKIIAFLDIYPTSFGHTLVIPKQHYENVLDADSDVFGPILSVVQKIGRAQVDSLGVKGFNVIVNNGKDAGQVIPHLHIHIIPRREGDGFTHWHGPKYESDAQMKEYAEKIRQQIH